MDPKEKMRAELMAARDIASKAEAAGRDLTPDEVAQASTHIKAYEAAKAEFEKNAAAADVKSQLDAIGLELGLERTPEVKSTPGGFIHAAKGKTLGQMFTEGTEYKALLAQFNGGNIGEKARVQSQPMGLKHIITRGVKALITGSSDTSAGAFVNTDVTDIVEALGRRELTLRDLISVRQTDSDTVEFVQQTTQPTSAAPVAEATSSAAPTTGASSGAALNLNAGGGYKPEGSFAWVKVTATVKTIAEWVPATKRGLADAAQLRGLIDDELRADLAEEEEDQILNGSGSGENLTGILSTSGIQAQAYSATVSGLSPLLETTRKAKTKVKTVGRARPTGYVLNPADWEKIELARLEKNPANEGAGVTVPTLHGLPVVESEAIAEGVGLVGDFRKAVLWDREQASITATDSHADFFIRNLVAVLGEERVAFGVTRPKAFVSIDLTA